MKSTEIRKIAILHYSNKVREREIELVRTIQLAEGNQQCFGKNFSGQCGEERCVWRVDCV